MSFSLTTLNGVSLFFSFLRTLILTPSCKASGQMLGQQTTARNTLLAKLGWQNGAGNKVRHIDAVSVVSTSWQQSGLADDSCNAARYNKQDI